MKKIIALLAVAAGIGFISPSESSARDYCHDERRIVSRHSCGAPIYAVYQVYGRDHCGRPVGRWVTLRSDHSSCRSCYGSRFDGHGHGHGHHDHGDRHDHHGHGRRGGGGFSFSFGG